MQNFIKENWFKLSVIAILLLMGLSVVYYFVIFIPKANEATNNFDVQQKCADAAKIFFKDNEYDNKTFFKNMGYDSNNPFNENDYMSHWNKSLNKCFIEITDTTRDSVNSADTDITLYDTISRIEYAGMMLSNSYLKPASLGYCELYPGNYGNSTSKNCNSEEEFDNFVKPFMTN